MEITPSIILLLVIVFATSGFMLCRRFRRMVLAILAMSFYITSKPFEGILRVSERLYEDRTARRRAVMLLQGLANLVFIGLSLWLAYREFGSDMFGENIFWFIVIFWAYVSFSVFLVRWDETTEGDIAGKLDELIREIRLERESREAGGKDR